MSDIEKFEYTAEDMRSVRDLGIARGLDMAAECLISIEIMSPPANDVKIMNYADFAKAVAGTVNQVAKHLRETASHYRGEPPGSAHPGAPTP